MPQGRPEPLRDRQTNPIVERIRKRLAAAGDDELELFPAPEDIYGVLVYVRTHEGFLLDRLKRLQRIKKPDERVLAAIDRTQEVLRENAVDRLLLVRRLRQLADVEEVRAVETARGLRVTWQKLAPHLGVNSAGGAELRAKRLKIAVTTQWADRTPRIVKRKAEAAAAAQQAVDDAHDRIRRAALELLALRHHFRAVEDLEVWWQDLDAKLREEELTPTGRASLAAHLRTILRDLIEDAEDQHSPVTSDAAALHAFNAALVAAGLT